jgi:hypothetical protein
MNTRTLENLPESVRAYCSASGENVSALVGEIVSGRTVRERGEAFAQFLFLLGQTTRA